MMAGGKQLFVRLLFGFAAIFLACTLRAADSGLCVLWWQVGDFTDPDSLEDVIVQRVNGGEDTTAADLGVKYARIREVSTGTYLTLDSGSAAPLVMDVPMTWQADVSAFASGSPEYAFVIELGNLDGSTWSTFAVSETVTYTDLVANDHIDTSSGYDPNPITPWMPTSYVVPEPTSGMLVLVGAALLALRRRRGALGRG